MYTHSSWRGDDSLLCGLFCSTQNQMTESNSDELPVNQTMCLWYHSITFRWKSFAAVIECESFDELSWPSDHIISPSLSHLQLGGQKTNATKDTGRQCTMDIFVCFHHIFGHFRLSSGFGSVILANQILHLWCCGWKCCFYFFSPSNFLFSSYWSFTTSPNTSGTLTVNSTSEQTATDRVWRDSYDAQVLMSCRQAIKNDH